YVYLFIPHAPTAFYPLSLHDALPIFRDPAEGIGLLAAREEGLRSRRARRDEPTLDLDRAVAGTGPAAADAVEAEAALGIAPGLRSEEHTSELQSRSDLVCRLLLEKKK